MPITREALAELVEEGVVTNIVLAVPDARGRLKGKTFRPGRFLAEMTDGAEMCGYILATDVDMEVFVPDFAGWRQGFGDLLVKPDWDSVLLYDPRTALVMGTPHFAETTPVRVASRHILAGQVESLRQMGYRAKVGLEVEFVLYRHGGECRIPAWADNRDYGLHTPPSVSDFFRELSEAAASAGIAVESVKTEGAPGQVEVALVYDDVLPACDAYTIFRELVLDIADRHEMVPVFMAAPQTGVASGLHLHLSLWDDGPLFAHEPGEDMPELMRQSIAGILSAAPHLAPLYAPNPNSYKRYRPRSFAPTRHNWGPDNRGCAIRTVGHGSGARLECRLAGADANPYLVASAYLAAIIHGITDKPQLRDACAGDAYQDDRTVPLPRDLDQALAYFQDSDMARALLGADVVQHYTRAARHELEIHRTTVTDVEQQRGTR